MSAGQRRAVAFLVKVPHRPGAVRVLIVSWHSTFMLRRRSRRRARIRPAPKIAITLMALFIPPLAAVKDTIVSRSFRGWWITASSFARLGARPPARKAIDQTLAWFRSTVPS